MVGDGGVNPIRRSRLQWDATGTSTTAQGPMQDDLLLGYQGTSSKAGRN